MKRPDTIAQRIDGIVIGGSAGGVEALSRILPALPRTLRAAVFIVLHLPRDRPSLLAGIFAPVCALPVSEAQDKEPVEAGHVYFAPPDYHLLIDKHRHLPIDKQLQVDSPVLQLSADEPVHFARPAIDVLFESAADVYGPHLLGIILTGANQDGTAGLRAIHDAGGLTLVQQPDTASSSFMPDSALAQTPVDFVLPLADIGALLSRLQPSSERTTQ